MRVTNSMIVNNFMRDLNTNMVKMEKLQGQLASGRKFAHISDDPVALIYSQAARNRLARLGHYQRTVQSAQDWLRQVESGVMELQGRVADVYTSVIDAATDVKGAADKNNVAQLIAQLRDHYLDTLNATFGDKYMFAGYNTPGDDSTTKTIEGPFTLKAGTWDLLYNGHNLSDMLQLQVDDGFGGFIPVDYNSVSGIFGGLRVDITGDPATVAASVQDILDEINTLVPELADINALIGNKAEELSVNGVKISTTENMIKDIDKEILEKYSSIEVLDELNKQKEALTDELRDLLLDDQALYAEMAGFQKDRDDKLAQLGSLSNFTVEYDPCGRVALSMGIVPVLGYETAAVDVPELSEVPGSIANMEAILDMLKDLKADVLTFDVGPGVSMEVTFNGTDMVLYQAPDGTTLNIFNVLHEVYKAASSDAPAEELGKFITTLQYAQNHLLAKTAEIGGRTQRLDLLAARYEQDYINYETMKSDAEDADFADVILNQKMAEAVYQAALSAGARIIQPTLMDFLR